MVNTVRGKILDSKSKRGLRDLLVVLYDIDNQQTATDGSITVAIPDDDPVRPYPVEPSTTSSANFTIEQANRADAKAWIDFPGRPPRIGVDRQRRQFRRSLTIPLSSRSVKMKAVQILFSWSSAQTIAEA